MSIAVTSNTTFNKVSDCEALLCLIELEIIYNKPIIHAPLT